MDIVRDITDIETGDRWIIFYEDDELTMYVHANINPTPLPGPLHSDIGGTF